MLSRDTRHYLNGIHCDSGRKDSPFSEMKALLKNSLAGAIFIMFMNITQGNGSVNISNNSENVTFSPTRVVFSNQTEEISPMSENGTNQSHCISCDGISESSNNGTSCICNDGVNGTEIFVKGSNNIKIIGFIVVPTLFSFGVFGNILTIIVMFGRRFRSRTSSMILIALAVSDTIFSCAVPFNKQLVRNIIGWDVRSLSQVGCSLFYIVLKTSKMTSSWLVVFISFERFVAVCFPLKIKLICTKRNTLIGITCLCCLLIVINGVWDFSNGIVDGVCVTISASTNSRLAASYLLLAVLMTSLLPASIIIILTSITVYQILRQSKLRRRLTTTNQRTDDTAKMSAMLIGVSISFLVLVTPIGIAQNVSYAMGENILETDDKGLIIAREVMQTLGQLNFSINFPLYVLCSREFRKRVASILRLQRDGKKRATSSVRGTTMETTNTSVHTNSQCKTEAMESEKEKEQEHEKLEMKKY